MRGLERADGTAGDVTAGGPARFGPSRHHSTTLSSKITRVKSAPEAQVCSRSRAMAGTWATG